jgi:hypothetical protein
VAQWSCGAVVGVPMGWQVGGGPGGQWCGGGSPPVASVYGGMEKPSRC